MTTIDAFLSRCRSYRSRRGISTSYLSRLLFDDGKVLDALDGGADVTTRRLSRAETLLGEFERALSRPEAASELGAAHP
jgi:hypothetical protein